MSRVVPPTEPNLDAAAAHLRAGGLVGLPTETVYGVAAHALDTQAVSRIYAAKDRPSFNPLILHVPVEQANLAALDRAGLVRANALDPEAQRVVERLSERWPGPLTLVLPKGPRVPDLTTAGLDTVAIRCPDHPVAQALLRRLDQPLAAPSANRSGRISPTSPQDVLEELGDALGLILDGGPCAEGLESTVVHVGPAGSVTLLRPGTLDRATLERLTDGPVHISEADPARPRSPGLDHRHYAPQTPFLALPTRCGDLPEPLWRRLRERASRASVIGVLCWTAEDASRVPRCLPGVEVHALALTHHGDPHEGARRLFSTLRALDALGADLLLAEPCPPAVDPHGLDFALRDRLRRAATALHDEP
ncbi:MAG: threonylcarbamoyl-AMP synthase [Deltaproteobacteria bacterium]|nr:MAG: threonylcarbamoyl-AMP synthase [Deltaproteobacteria bacterium]